jgi:hypothetical protein
VEEFQRQSDVVEEHPYIIKNYSGGCDSVGNIVGCRCTFKCTADTKPQWEKVGYASMADESKALSDIYYAKKKKERDDAQAAVEAAAKKAGVEPQVRNDGLYRADERRSCVRS